MPDLLDLATVDELPAARTIAALIASGASVARKDLNAALTAAHGGTDADGRWTQRDSFELLEHAVALHLASASRPLAAFADVAGIVSLVERLPTQTVRSEEQLDLQQFSTPADIAAIAVLLAAIGADDVVLEPSAGNGLLVAQAPLGAALQLNEIDPNRRHRELRSAGRNGRGRRQGYWRSADRERFGAAASRLPQGGPGARLALPSRLRSSRRRPCRRACGLLPRSRGLEAWQTPQLRIVHSRAL